MWVYIVIMLVFGSFIYLILRIMFRVAKQLKKIRWINRKMGLFTLWTNFNSAHWLKRVTVTNLKNTNSPHRIPTRTPRNCWRRRRSWPAPASATRRRCWGWRASWRRTWRPLRRAWTGAGGGSTSRCSSTLTRRRWGLEEMPRWIVQVAAPHAPGAIYLFI